MSEKMMYGCSLKGYRSVLLDTLLKLGAADEKLIVVDAETGTATNCLGFRDVYPDRYVTCGIAEQAALSFAFALSRSGLKPVVPLFSCFMARRSCDQAYLQIGYPHANVTLVGCYSGMTTPNTGATHQSINDIAIMRSIPGMTVIEAADPFEFGQALEASVAYNGPVFLRVIRGDIAPYDSMNCVPEGHQFKLGRSTVLREGKDISIMGSGLMVTRALEAADKLAERGVSAEVVDLSAIKPMDVETVVASARKTGRVVTCENNNIYGGVGSAVAECLATHCPVPMRMVGVKDEYGWSGPLESLLPMYGLTTDAVLSAASELLG